MDANIKVNVFEIATDKIKKSASEIIYIGNALCAAAAEQIGMQTVLFDIRKQSLSCLKKSLETKGVI